MNTGPLDRTTGSPRRATLDEPTGLCPSCFEEIHPEARVCKVCGQPRHPARRFFGAALPALSLLIALGSVGIAWVQVTEARDARREMKAAESREAMANSIRDGALAEAAGAQDALAVAAQALSPEQRAALLSTISVDALSSRPPLYPAETPDPTREGSLAIGRSQTFSSIPEPGVPPAAVDPSILRDHFLLDALTPDAERR